MRWLTLTHTQRWHAHRGSAGAGHLDQGRFKSFPVQDDGHLATVCRYVERNPVRAALVARAERWQWSRLWRWGTAAGRPSSLPTLNDWLNESVRDEKDGIIGYEINLNRYFYRYQPPRPLEAIEKDIKAVEVDVLKLLKEVAG